MAAAINLVWPVLRANVLGLATSVFGSSQAVVFAFAVLLGVLWVVVILGPFWLFWRRSSVGPSREYKAREAALQVAAAEIKSIYPQLDEAHVQARNDAIDFVVETRDRLAGEGLPLDVALRKATALAVERYGLKPVP